MKEFNIVIAGVGGQGIITLAKIIAESAFEKGYDVRTSELHGLSQRGGGVECHIRVGERINSSIVKIKSADLIIATEPLEALRSALRFANSETNILYEDEKIIPVSVSTEKIKYPDVEAELRKISKNIFKANGTKTVLEKIGPQENLNMFLLGCAYGKKLLPLEKENIFSAINEIVKPKFVETCRKAFDLGSS